MDYENMKIKYEIILKVFRNQNGGLRTEIFCKKTQLILSSFIKQKI